MNGRNTSDSQHDKGAGNKVLPFSIEAILSAPHPNREMPVSRKRAHSSSRENHEDRTSPLSTLEDFTSSNLPEDSKDQSENPETGELKTSLFFNRSRQQKPGSS